MKQIVVLIITVFFISSCVSKSGITKIKDYKSVEKVKIGMQMNTAIDLIKKKYYVEKMQIPGYEGEKKYFQYVVYSNQTKKVILFSFNGGYKSDMQDEVYRLAIKNSKYHFIDGISVGMNVQDLKEKTKIKSVSFDFDDGLFIKSDVFDGGFLMDISSIKDKSYNYQQPQISSLPRELKIKEIIIF